MSTAALMLMYSSFIPHSVALVLFQLHWLSIASGIKTKKELMHQIHMSFSHVEC